METDKVVKVVFAGHMGVGKTSILHRFDHRNNNLDVSSTVGASFTRKFHMKDKRSLIIDVWDTAGQERFYSIAPLYFRNTNHCILVFDLTDHESFKMVGKWMKICADANNGSSCLTYSLVGNKTDIPERTVSRNEVNEYCRNNGIQHYIETSAYTGEGIKVLKRWIINHAFEHEDDKPSTEIIIPTETPYRTCSSCYW
jgi:small GTP-binding protein